MVETLNLSPKGRIQAKCLQSIEICYFLGCARPKQVSIYGLQNTLEPSGSRLTTWQIGPIEPGERSYLLCEAAPLVRAQNLSELIGPSNPRLALFR